MQLFYILLIITILYFIYLFTSKNNSKNKEKLLQKMKDSWGKPKEKHFNFDGINIYFEHNQDESFHRIEDKTALDLDLDLVFKEIDHTKSHIGQQYFYNALRTPTNSISDLKKLDIAVEFYTQNKANTFELQSELSLLNKYEDYYLPLLIYGDLPVKLSWIRVIPILQVITLISLIGSFFYPPLLLVLLAIVPINMILHYWNKNKIGKYNRIFNRLSKIYATADSVYQKVDISLINLPVEKELKEVKGIIQKIGWLRIDQQLQQNEYLALFWFVVEIIKVISLTEFSVFHNVVELVNTKKESFHQLFKLIGKTDFILSIASYRSSLDYFSKPIFTDPKKEIEVVGIRHPMIEDCISNDLHLNANSLLLTGSNMSGKTTFIRAVGINVLLAQSIGTTLTESYKAPILKLATSIRIADDVSESKSYYLAEVDSINELLQNSQSEEGQYLFIIDEVFKGTNTIERVGAAKAILEFLNQKNHLVMVSTHDLELTNFLKDSFVLYHFQEQIENGKLFFDYKLKQGILQQRNAIRILELAEFPNQVIQEAQRVSQILEDEKSESGFE